MRDPIDATPAIPDPTGQPDRAALEALVRRLEREPGAAGAGDAVPIGCPAVDAALPAGGLMRSRVHEVVGESRSEVRDAGVFGFAIALLTRLAPAESSLLWCARTANVLGGAPSARGLADLGIDPDRVVFVEAEDEADRLWVMEEGLATAGLGAVIAEFDPPRRPQTTASRRLQLAAEKGGVSGLILRSRMATPNGARVREPGVVETRWRVAAAASPLAPDDLRPVWDVTLERARRGRPGRWRLAWDSDGRRFSDLGAVTDGRDRVGPSDRTVPAPAPIPTADITGEAA